MRPGGGRRRRYARADSIRHIAIGSLQNNLGLPVDATARGIEREGSSARSSIRERTPTTRWCESNCRGKRTPPSRCFELPPIRTRR